MGLLQQTGRSIARWSLTLVAWTGGEVCPSCPLGYYVPSTSVVHNNKGTRVAVWEDSLTPLSLAVADFLR